MSEFSQQVERPFGIHSQQWRFYPADNMGLVNLPRQGCSAQEKLKLSYHVKLEHSPSKLQHQSEPVLKLHYAKMLLLRLPSRAAKLDSGMEME